MTTPALPLDYGKPVAPGPGRGFHIPREAGMLIALSVLCAGLWISNPKFLGQSNVVNTTRLISILGIFSIGIAFVIITGGIDLSIGSIIGLTGVIIAKLSSNDSHCYGLSLWIGIPVALAIACLIGLAQGTLITRLGLQPFIVTLGGMLTLRGISQVIVEGASLSIGDGPLTGLANGGVLNFGSGPIIPYTVLIFAAVVIVGIVLLHFTVFGRYVYAIGGNREAAAYSGVPVKHVETMTYVISAFLAGVAGVCYASYVGQMSQNVGIAYELTAIAAAVIGGVSLRGGEGTVGGIIIGCGIMCVIQNGITMVQIPYTDAQGRALTRGLSTDWTFVIIGGVILIAVVLDQVVHIVQARRRTQRAGAVPISAIAVVTAPAAQ